jgi:phage protein U
MFAYLGDIEFEALTGFSDFSEKLEMNIVQHDRINAKPRLQNTGQKLSQVSIKIKLHFSLGDPNEKITKLTLACKYAKVLPLVWGNGVFLNTFVITAINRSIVQCDDLGNIKEADLELSLLEAAIYNPAAQLQIEARRRAFANKVNGAEPIIGNFGTVSESKAATVLLTSSEGEANAVDSNAKEIENNPSARTQTFKNTNNRLYKVDNSLRSVQGIILNNTGLNDRSQVLLADIRNALRLIAILITISEAEDVANFKQGNIDLQLAMRRVSVGAQIIAAIVATRQKI